MKISLSPSPDLLHLYAPPLEALIVVTDVFRASATMLSALYHGALSIRPVATEEEAQSYLDREDYLVAAERDALRCAFAPLGNDPEEYTPQVVQGKHVVLTTTNGTRSIDRALSLGYRCLTVGSFGNISLLAQHILSVDYPEVVVIAAGWKGTLCAEDCLFAAALYERVAHEIALRREAGEGDDLPTSLTYNDALFFPLEAYRTHRADLCNYTSYFEHYRRLERLGRLATIPICLEEDRYPVLPYWQESGVLKPL